MKIVLAKVNTEETIAQSFETKNKQRRAREWKCAMMGISNA